MDNNDISTKRNTSKRDKPETHSVNKGNLPAAYMPPTTAPIEHPETLTMSKPCSSNTWITPIWALPRAPPLPSTNATVGMLIVLSSCPFLGSSLGVNTPFYCRVQCYKGHNNLAHSWCLVLERRMIAHCLNHITAIDGIPDLPTDC